MVKARPALSLLASAIAATLAAPSAHASWRFQPTADWQETWSDNVSQSPPGQEKSRLISTLSPGFSLDNDTPRVKFHADYRLNLYTYSGDRSGTGSNSNSQFLSADMRSRLAGDWLFMDAGASVSQVATSAFGPQVLPGNDYSSTNRNEVRSYRINPYVRHNFGTLANLELRYLHDRVSSDNAGFGQSNRDSVDFKLLSGPSFRKFSWNAIASHQVIDDSIASRSTSSTANLGLRYLLSNQLALDVGAGYDNYDYDSSAGATKGAAYNAGFGWTPSSRSSLQFSAGHRFYGPSYSLSALHRSRNTTWNISYNDSITNSRNQFTLPSTVNTASLLDSLFAVSIPDPVARAAAIQAYIAATGLPNALPNAVNYFSNRFQLQKQFSASSAVKMAHSAAVFSVYRMRREAVSNGSVDSALLGNQNFLLNENTQQSGASAALNYQLGSRTSATLTAAVNKTESLSASRVDHNQQLSLHLTRQFASRLSTIAEIRHIRGNTLATGDRKYTENSVTVGLAYKF